MKISISMWTFLKIPISILDLVYRIPLNPCQAFPEYEKRYHKMFIVIKPSSQLTGRLVEVCTNQTDFLYFQTLLSLITLWIYPNLHLNPLKISSAHSSIASQVTLDVNGFGRENRAASQTFLFAFQLVGVQCAHLTWRQLSLNRDRNENRNVLLLLSLSL